jgi:hypothetical protein
MPVFISTFAATAVVQAATANQPDVIEVVGTRQGQALKIDRRTYQVQQNPHSAQKDATQLLRGLPAVTVSPDDEIMLLGSGNVRISVDGRPYPGDPKPYLRALHGTDIERIEIITNPSAQYSAEGAGGIINFVLRHKQAAGLSGNARVETNSPRHGDADATVKYKHGRWTYELEAFAAGGRKSGSRYHKVRSVEQAPGTVPTINAEDGRSLPRDLSGEVTGTVTYEVDPKTSISAKLDRAGYRSTAHTIADFVGLTPDFESFSGRLRDRHSGSLLIGQLNFDHKGSKEGETLTAGVTVFRQPVSRAFYDARFSNGGNLSIGRLQRLLNVDGQADWQHPIGKKKILSIGGSWNVRQQVEHYRFASTDAQGALGSDTVDQSRTIDSTRAAYATFQQPIGSWTVMPGIRMEANSRAISSPGVPDVRIDRTDPVPDAPRRSSARQVGRPDTELQQTHRSGSGGEVAAVQDGRERADDLPRQSASPGSVDRLLRAQPSLPPQGARRRRDPLRPPDQPLVEYGLYSARRCERLHLDQFWPAQRQGRRAGCEHARRQAH